MKKMFKTLIALCLTVAMLTSLFAGVAFAANEVCVEWYGFDNNNVTVALGAGTYQSVAPRFFPANATETDVIWSVSDETKATIDEKGTVTLLAAGNVTVYATLENKTALVRDPSFGVKGASYTLTIADTALSASPAEANFASAGKVKDIVISGAVGPLSIVGTSNELAATASVIDDETIAIESVAPGYAEITVTDGVSNLVIPAFIQPVDLSVSKDTWKQLFPKPAEGEKASASQAGYLQWWLEAIPINKNASGINAGAGVLGYGNPILHTENLTVTTNGNTDGQGKTYFRWIGDGYNYYRLSDGKGMTVADRYQFLNIRAPKAGAVNIIPKTLEMTTTSTSDGSYIAIFVENSDGNLTRVFPAETADDEYITDSNAYSILNVTRNWLWVYPTETRFGKFKVGDHYQNWDSGLQVAKDALDPTSQPYILTQEDVNRKADFIAKGATFNVKAGDIIRVAMHCGNEGNSDGMTFMPIFSYVDSNVTGVIESETEIEITKGETATFKARLNPVGTTAPVTVTPAYAAGTDVALSTYKYRTGSESNIDDYGCVDVTLKASDASAVGTGYYRVNYGSFSQLVRISVTAGESGPAVDEGEEAGVEVVLGENAGTVTPPEEPGEGGGEGDEGDEGEDEETFTFEFNPADTSLTLTLPGNPARSGQFTWTNTNAASEAKNYCIFSIPVDGLGEVIDLRSLPTKYGHANFTASANASGTNEGNTLKHDPDDSYWSKGSTINVFWFFGNWADLAANGLRTVQTYLGYTRP